MEMKYFKQHFESCDREWTIYGCYSDLNIQPGGDVLCYVIEVMREDNNVHIEQNVYQEYIEPDEVTSITKEEYQAVINKHREANGYYDKADEVLRTLL